MKTLNFFSLFLFAGMIFFSCKKPVEPQQTLNPNERLCLYIGTDSINQAAPIFNDFFEGLNAELSDDMKIQQFVDWLKLHECIIDAEIICVSCVYTLPPQSEVLITFSENSEQKCLVLDILMSDTLNFVNAHECYGVVENPLIGKWCSDNRTITFTEDMQAFDYFPQYLSTDNYFTYSLEGDSITFTFHQQGSAVSERFKYLLNIDELTIFGFSNPFSVTSEIRTDVVFTRCENIENRYCAEILQSSPAESLLSDTEMATCTNLFEINGLDYSNLQFYRFEVDELGYTHIRCYQYCNNLLVFTNQLIYHFNADNICYFLSGNLCGVINLETTPAMNQDDVIDLFLNAVEQDEANKDNKEEFIQNCFELEFGYYNLNADISYEEANFTKAWKITPKNSQHPYAYINDNNSEIIDYFNGFYSFYGFYY